MPLMVRAVKVLIISLSEKSINSEDEHLSEHSIDTAYFKPNMVWCPNHGKLMTHGKSTLKQLSKFWTKNPI